MPDLWFFVGLAMGIALAGLAAVGSFARGADSVRRKAWSVELTARGRAVVASRAGARTVVVAPVTGSSRQGSAHAAFARSALPASDATVT